MLENIDSINDTDMDATDGPMDGCTMENSTTSFGMGRVRTPFRMVIAIEVNLRMGREKGTEQTLFRMEDFTLEAG